MPKRRFSEEQIVMLLRQLEVPMMQEEGGDSSLPGCGHIAVVC
jgi:hypothetical protein